MEYESVWDLGYVSRKEDKDSILESGIIAKNGIIILFEDVYYRYKGIFKERNVCDDVVRKTLCNWIFEDKDMRCHTPFALFHVNVNREGLFDNLKNFTIKKPADKKKEKFFQYNVWMCQLFYVFLHTEIMQSWKKEHDETVVT